MNKVRTYNKISVKGLEKFSLDKYEIASEIGTPDAVMLPHAQAACSTQVRLS